MNVKLCGRHYFRVQPLKGRSKYICNKTREPSYRDKCPAKSLDQQEVESIIKTKVRVFLEQPVLFASDAVQGQSVEDINKSIKDLKRQWQNTLDDERIALRKLTPEAFEIEQKQLVARRIWLTEEIDRQQVKLDILEKQTINERIVQSISDKLRGKLDNATENDWHFIFECLGVKVLAFGDGTWDVEIAVPVKSELIANKTPGCLFRCRYSTRKRKNILSMAWP